jgi:hypothetical protein
VRRGPRQAGRRGGTGVHRAGPVRAFYGPAHISRRGRPGLRLTVWRAVWPMLLHNPVMAAKYQAMTEAADTAAARAGAGSQQVTAAAAAARARRAKARVACAASLLRWRPWARPATRSSSS